ncbi:NAD(P)/FAD-dependent oxidoreductase [Achromobacter sp. AGC39]
MPHPTKDVLIVGAGIIGAACARHLAAAGLSVHVLDAGLKGATQAGMGHLVVMDGDPDELALSSLSMDTWRQWGPRMNAADPACAYTECGTLWVAANPDDMAEAERKHARLVHHGIAATLLSARQLADAEPFLRPGLAGALHVPGDGLVYAPNAARWLLTHAPPGVSFEAARVDKIDERGAVLADGSRRPAKAVVLAAGMLATHLCNDLPLVPKKGHLAITDRYPTGIRHQLVELAYMASTQQRDGASVAFNVQPRPTGQLLIGSSRQIGQADSDIDPMVLSRMLKQAIDFLPGLSGMNLIRTWTGIRAATPDGLPLIGPHPSRPGLWLALGHEGLGVTTAPATAALLTALMTNATPPLAAAPFAPSRSFDEVTP